MSEEIKKLEEIYFKSNKETYTVKLSDDSRCLTKTFQRQKDTFNFRAYYRDINTYFLAIGNTIYMSDSGWLDNYNSLLKPNPNPTTRQKIKLYNEFFKLREKTIATGLVTSNHGEILYTNNYEMFLVGYFHKDKNLLKRTQYINRIEIKGKIMGKIKEALKKPVILT